METERKRTEKTREMKRLSAHRLLLIGIGLPVIIIAAVVIFSWGNIFPTPESTVSFDFDHGYPLLAETQNTPLNQTVSDITAHFSSPSDTVTAPAFSIQSYDTTFIKLSQFSGKYLYDNKPSRDTLEIEFSQQLESVTLTFATVEYRTDPSNIKLTAFLGSSDTSPVGSTTASGTYQTGLYPQGILSFDSADKPFNLLRIEIPFQGTESPPNFYVDNIVIALFG